MSHKKHKVKGGESCVFREWILCEDQNCTDCGFNSDVEAQRMTEYREKEHIGKAVSHVYL